jgi:hypothetical protein
VPETEKDSLLARIIEDDTSYLEAVLRQRVFSEIRAKYPATVSSAPRRTAAQILARADAVSKDRQRTKREAAERERIRREQEEAEQRRRHLEALRGRETDLWTEANQHIVTKRPRNYDEPISILQDLRELAEKDGASSAFHQRMQSLCRDHASKPALLEKFQKARLALQRQAPAPDPFRPHSRY